MNLLELDDLDVSCYGLVFAMDLVISKSSLLAAMLW
jgi:hypothetical protein